jgi:hypothetical protein
MADEVDTAMDGMKAAMAGAVGNSVGAQSHVAELPSVDQAMLKGSDLGYRKITRAGGLKDGTAINQAPWLVHSPQGIPPAAVTPLVPVRL